MTNHVRFAVTLALTAASVSLAACGGGQSRSQNVATDSAIPASVAHQVSPVAAGAQSHTWTVLAGGDVRDQAFQALDFFDETITIDEGDSVTWTANGDAEPHTVAFLGPRTAPPPPNDPSNVLPAGGTSYDGSVYTSSGFIAQGQTYTLTFPKAGVFPYLCLIHQPAMTGVIVVQPKGTPYPHSQGYHSGHGQAALNAVLASAKGSLSAFPYADGGTTLAAGLAPGLAAGPPTNATVLRFLNHDGFSGSTTSTVAVGTTLTWVNQSNNEPHTVTFPAVGQQPPPNPNGPPSGGTTYDGTALVNSGVLLPNASFQVTFTRRGTYTYYCLFHDDSGMIGTVIVQ